MKPDLEFSRALAINLRLKSVILAIIFGAILLLQIIVILCVDIDGKSITDFIPRYVLIYGPLILLLAVLSEILAMRYFAACAKGNKRIAPLAMYGITFLESCFPFITILMGWSYIPADFVVPITFLLHSPPFMMFFIMIILSALLLDKKICIFSGILAGICMLILVKLMQPNQTPAEQFETSLGYFKSAFLVLSGIVTGFLAQRTQKAVVASLEAKNTLIYSLDKLVAEKTSEIKFKNIELESKNKDITDSINYAKNIQQAILPSEYYIRSLLPDHFIFYRPKDIVSGDFYWVETQQKKIFIAAADCTGHGVPGAMVSVVCANAMNRALKEFKLVDPGKILDKVRELISETFSHSASAVKDGMDISLCVIDPSSQQIHWAGANNALLICSKDLIPLHLISEKHPVIDEETRLSVIAGDKQPVGSHPHPTPFTTHELASLNNDTFYLMTDGFSDQFGGPGGKKYKTKPLKELLRSLHGTSLPEQKIFLEKTFSEWKGDLEQVDDVLIIGLKI